MVYTKFLYHFIIKNPIDYDHKHKVQGAKKDSILGIF